MSQFPPPPGQPNQQYSLPAVTRTSAAAITSLICGLLGCMPFLAGLIAVITGIVGINATKNPGVKGRGLAIAGLILGLLSLAGWGISCGFAYHMMTGPEHDFAKTYVAALANNDTVTVQADSAANITPDQLAAIIAKMQPWGTLTDTTIVAVNIGNQDAQPLGMVVAGSCTFSTGQKHAFAMTVKKDDTGKLKATSFSWDQSQPTHVTNTTTSH